MAGKPDEPVVFKMLQGEAQEVTPTPYGNVGKVFSGEGVEAVWVSKQDEEIEPGWFSQPMADLIVVLQGQLKVEFEEGFPERVMEPGDLLVLPAGRRCRAYRWPREREEATVFLAVYPREE